MARADLIRFDCPVCGRHVRVAQESAGGWAECAGCHEAIRVPGWSPATEETLSLQEIDTFRPSEPELPTLVPEPAEEPRGRGWLVAFLLLCVVGLSATAVVVYLKRPKPEPTREPDVVAAPVPPVVPVAPVPPGDAALPVAPPPREVTRTTAVAPPPISPPIVPVNSHQDADVADRLPAKALIPDPGANDRDLKRLQGRWFPRRVYTANQKDVSDTRDGIITIDGTAFRQQTLDRDGRFGEERATITGLDAAAKQFELRFADGRAVRVLYLIDEDELRLLRVPARGPVPPRLRAPQSEDEQLDVCSRFAP